MKEINDFDKEVVQSTGLVLVDIYADWCGPCRVVGPMLKSLSEDPDLQHVTFLKLDQVENDDQVTKMGVSVLPTLLLYKDGKELDRKVGASPKPKLKEWLLSK